MIRSSLPSVRRRGPALLCCLSLALAHCLNADAATMCVQTGDIFGLQSALNTAAGNGEDDVIKLQAGQYAMPSGFLLDYEAATEHHNITVEGGYGPNFGDPCGLASTSPDATLTVLDGGLLRLRMNAGATGTVALKALTIANTTSADASHAPIEIIGGADAASDIAIENVAFTGNTGISNSAVYVVANQGALHVHNSLFASNTSFAGTNAIRLGTLQVSASACTEIIGSTFTDNASAPMSAVDLYANCLAFVANDIFWGNVGGDVSFAFPQMTWLVNSDLGDLSAAIGTQSANLLSVNPLFDSSFSLGDFSPLRNAGDTGGFFYVVGPYDVVGHERTIGARPDIGAYEIFDSIFAHDFDFQLPF